MYLHLGSDCMVKNSEIIAIFNLRSPQSDIYEEYVQKSRGLYEVVDLSEKEEDRSSCILTPGVIYISPISAMTLKKRAEESFLAEAVYANF